MRCGVKTAKTRRRVCVAAQIAIHVLVQPPTTGEALLMLGRAINHEDGASNLLPIKTIGRYVEHTLDLNEIKK